MRQWHLQSGDPLALTIAADARLGPTDYGNDQIWELLWRGGDPPSLALRTTYGLQARSMRLFPEFRHESLMISDPKAFPQPPVLRRFAPNYLDLDFSPFPGLAVRAEYWVPGSQVVAGRLHLENTSERTLLFDLRWIAQLTPTEGERMAPTELGAATVLVGRSEALAPVMFMTGVPQVVSSPYPALLHGVELEPGAQRAFTWAHTGLEDPAAGLDLARRTVARQWEAEIARVEMLSASDLEIHTGDPHWDAALALSQAAAHRLIVGPTDQLPSTSIVLTRQSDQGYSLRGDGGDYTHLWNGQPPLETHYLAGYLLPSAPQIAAGLLRNFLHTQDEYGGLDWKPGLGGQRSRLLATPLLADLAWQIHQVQPEPAFLAEVFPPLLRFFQAWFDKRHDHDSDGLPEWDHPFQTGFEDHAIFSRWHPWAQGVDINTVESPALGAMLYNESQALLHMAEYLEDREAVAELRRRSALLRQGVEACWEANQASYSYRDRDSHTTTQARFLGERVGCGLIEVHQAFVAPIRLQLTLETHDESRRPVQVFIHGYSLSGAHRVEQLDEKDFKWHAGRGYMTGKRLYAEVEHVDLRGLEDGDQTSLFTAGYCCSDHTLLLPLWAGLPRPQRAAQLVENTILDEELYWKPFGPPACPHPPKDPAAVICRAVHLPVASLVGAGLVRYEYRQEAAELVGRLMQAVITALQEQHNFYHLYNSLDGRGLGEPGALHGLAPLALFLQTLGVRILSTRRVALDGFNPFPWPVTVKYRGLTVMCQANRTQVIFPGGQTVMVEDPQPQIICLDEEPGQQSAPLAPGSNEVLA